jgi:hypothetical protein
MIARWMRVKARKPSFTHTLIGFSAVFAISQVEDIAVHITLMHV